MQHFGYLFCSSRNTDELLFEGKSQYGLLQSDLAKENAQLKFRILKCFTLNVGRKWRLVNTSASMCKILSRIPQKISGGCCAPAEMPGYSQLPCLHEWWFAMLFLHRTLTNETGFSWFHHPDWKHGIKRWWRDHLTLNVSSGLMGNEPSFMFHQVIRWSNRRSRCQQQDGSSPIRGDTFEGPAAIRRSDLVSPPLQVQEVT